MENVYLVHAEQFLANRNIALIMLATKQITLIEAYQYIQQIDLSYIVEKMISKTYSLPRWTRQDADLCCSLYKNFLYLQKKYLPEPLVPTREIDEFWHNHILYTQKYFTDCYHIFGHYLHHEPASSAAESATQLVTDFLKTKDYYFKEFGESLDLVREKDNNFSPS